MLVDYNEHTNEHRFRLESWKELFVVEVEELVLKLGKIKPPKIYKFAYQDILTLRYVYWSWPAYPFLAAWQYVLIGVWFIYLQLRKIKHGTNKKQ